MGFDEEARSLERRAQLGDEGARLRLLARQGREIRVGLASSLGEDAWSTRGNGDGYGYGDGDGNGDGNGDGDG